MPRPPGNQAPPFPENEQKPPSIQRMHPPEYHGQGFPSAANTTPFPLAETPKPKKQQRSNHVHTTTQENRPLAGTLGVPDRLQPLPPTPQPTSSSQPGRSEPRSTASSRGADARPSRGPACGERGNPLGQTDSFRADLGTPAEPCKATKIVTWHDPCKVCKI